MVYDSLISARTLRDNLENPDWRIIDCRYDLKDETAGYNKYLAAHIPGAIYADLKTELSAPVSAHSGRHPLPSIDKLSHQFSIWGIHSETQVIVYDDAFGSFAGRLWWLLNWLGHSKVAVLNGGLAAWDAHHYPMTTEIRSPQPAHFVPVLNENMAIEQEQLENNLAEHTYTVIDVRDPERFSGQMEPIDPVAGHIPGAINIPWKTNIDKNGIFLPENDLLDHYKDILKNDCADHLVFMCGSGVTACHGLIALKYLGYDGAKLYPGSWSEWIRNPGHPVAVKTEPH